MRLVRRNLRSIWYLLFLEKKAVVDTDGNETGEIEITYSNPVELRCNVSPARGNAESMIFGTDADYDRVIVTDRMDCPIDENSVLYVDRVPKWENGVLINTYDYTVKRVAKSLTHISYAVSKAEVS